MKYRASFLPQAEADLFRLYEYIAAEAGPAVAGPYIDRMEAACLELATFPRRGAKRDNIRRGLRTVGFERRVTIAFQVSRADVVIVGIFYGGQDFEGRLRDE